MFEEERKPRKPKQPAEILDTPRRYLCRSKAGNYVVTAETKQEAGANGIIVSALMGTHEDQKHAEKRLGWAG